MKAKIKQQVVSIVTVTCSADDRDSMLAQWKGYGYKLYDEHYEYYKHRYVMEFRKEIPTIGGMDHEVSIERPKRRTKAARITGDAG